jgi:hypothetical protein
MYAYLESLVRDFQDWTEVLLPNRAHCVTRGWSFGERSYAAIVNGIIQLLPPGVPAPFLYSDRDRCRVNLDYMRHFARHCGMQEACPDAVVFSA